VSYSYRKKINNKGPDIIVPYAKDFERIITALLNEQYNKIGKSLIYKHFYVSFIAAYSDWCEKCCIGEAEVRRRYEWKEDKDGFRVGPTWEYKISIEIPYIDSYDRYISDINMNLMGTLFSGDASKIITNIRELNKIGEICVKSAIDCRLFLNNYFNGGKDCMSESIQTVYKRLLIFEQIPDK
jgi:hypothetical protein